jgi:hypothetical protein
MALSAAITISRYRCHAQKMMGMASRNLRGQPHLTYHLPRQHLLQRLLKGRYGAVDIAQFVQPEQA